MLAESLGRGQQEAAFQQWLKERRAAAGLVDPKAEAG